MRKILTITALVLMATAMTFCLTACNDDDEDGSDGGSMPSPTLTDSKGTTLQIRSLTGGVSYEFGYDENGTLTNISNYEFEGKTFQITRNNSSFTVTLNGNGLVSKITEKDEYKDSYGIEKHDVSMTLSYNGSKQITGATATGKYDYQSEKYGSQSYSGTGTAKMTWSGGNITKVAISSKGSGIDDGERYTDSDYGTYTISYGNKENPFHQMPFYLTEELFDIGEFGGVFGALGLLGAGPKNLPSGYVLEEYYDDGDEDTSTRTYVFTQNSDGSIKTESENSNSSIITYRYNTVETRAALEEQFESIMPNMRGFGKRFFKRVRH